MSESQGELWVVIPAAGSGSRMSSETPKQYLTLQNHPVIDYSIQLFRSHHQVTGIVVVTQADDKAWNKLQNQYNDKVMNTLGGKERSDSVLNGLKFVEQQVSDLHSTWVMVHDAARPCLTRNDLNHLIESRKQFNNGAILAAPVVDTLKQVKENQLISKTHNRELYARAFTPQLAPLVTLKKALEKCRQQKNAVTDEAQAMELYRKPMGIVYGRRDNIKVTYPEDIALAEFILKQQQTEGVR